MTGLDNSLTICIVNYNSSHFILNTLYCLEKITKNNYKMIIRDNNSNLKDYLNLEKNIRNYSNVELYRVKDFKLTGSMAHGVAINDLVNKIDTKYGVILDADCTFLYKNWDQILMNEIDEKCPIIGTQASQDYGSKKQGIFPVMYAILFYTNILKKIQPDFKPIESENFIDTGHQLKEQFLKKGYKGKLLYAKNTRTFKLGPFRKIFCEEYYLNGIDKIFACHFGRGSSLGRGKYLLKKNLDGKNLKLNLKYNIPFIGKSLVKIKGKRERNKWIKICEKIVDNFNDINNNDCN